MGLWLATVTAKDRVVGVEIRLNQFNKSDHRHDMRVSLSKMCKVCRAGHRPSQPRRQRSHVRKSLCSQRDDAVHKNSMFTLWCL